MSRRKRKRKPARRREPVEARQRILALCEGERTEPEYLEGFKRWCRNPLVDVEISGPEGVPFTLVGRARERRDQAEAEARRRNDDNLAFDQVWCVFDRDDHPRFKEAIQTARDNGLHLAVSNPCAELWLLLHFRESPGLQHREDIKPMLKKYGPEFDKGVDFDDYREGYFEARSRATKLDQRCEEDGEPFRNPSTGIYLVTDQISLYSAIHQQQAK